MSVTSRREREKLQRRQDILDAAREVFWQRGYVRTTMPQIAEAAELAPGTLYLYFESKTALYVELLMEGYDELLQRVREQVAEGGTPRRQAEGMIDAFFGFARDCPEYFDIIFFVLQMEVGGTRQGALPPAQVEGLKAKEDACKELAARILAEGGAPRSAATIDAVWSMLVGTIFYFRRAGEGQLEAVEGEAKRLVLNAMFGPEGD